MNSNSESKVGRTVRRVLVSRTECAEVEVEAASDEEARQTVTDKINAALCIADLDFDWETDGGIRIESLGDESVEQYFERVNGKAVGGF